MMRRSEKSKELEPAETFFVIYLESEGSYSTVPAVDVICDESVQVGDEVSFIWNNKQLDGVVKFINGSYDVCVKKSMELSQLSKKEKKGNNSFDCENPRKSAIKCKQNMLSNSGKRKQSDSQSGNSEPGCSKTKKQKDSNKKSNAIRLTTEACDKELLKKIFDQKDYRKDKSPPTIYDSDEDESSGQDKPEKRIQKFAGDKESNLSSSSGEASNESEDESSADDNTRKVRKLSAELAAKFDLKTLELLAMGLLSKNISPGTGAEKKGSISNNSPKKNEHDEKSHMGLEESSGLELLEEKRNSPNVPHHEKLAVPKAAVPSTSGRCLSNMYAGDMFRVKDPSEGKPINDTQSIFCDQEVYDKVESSSKSATAAARKLMDGVFTLEALKASSLTGMPPRGKGKHTYADVNQIRPFLDPKGVKAIIAEALRLQSIKHWKPKKDEGHIRHAMGVRLNELRGPQGSNANLND